MSRAFALSLSLLALCVLTALPARAEPVPAPPTLRLSEPSAVWGASSRLSALSVAATASARDADLTDQWVQRMTEARAMREQKARWAVPLMLGIAGATAAPFIFLPDQNTTSQALFIASTALPIALIIPAVLASPPNKSRWLALGGFLFSAAFSGAGLALAANQDDCNGWCGNEKAVGWLSAGFLPTMLLGALAFVDRGPTLQELQDYAHLPPGDSRVVMGRKLIARIDRAERKALAIEAAIDLMALGILATGAALVQDDSEQKWLLGFGGAGFGIHCITTFATLLSPTRLERLSMGQAPAARERVFW
jgi:hypothetical protein